mmetsp:Transcript_5305/g.17657  ORF Transcript_5305/g.17657 Transcript_5305/m.17657 type:complete len:221 (+) Transcript_5305:389-1051(+)
MISSKPLMSSAGDRAMGGSTCRKRYEEAVGRTRLSKKASWSSSSALSSATSATSAESMPSEWVTPRAKRRCATRGLVPCWPNRTTELCEMAGRRTGAQFCRRSSSSMLYMVGYMSRRCRSSANSLLEVKAKMRGHFGGFGTMTDTYRMPLALSCSAAACTAACAAATVASSAPAPVSMDLRSARWSTLTGMDVSSGSYDCSSVGMASPTEAKSGRTASWP